MDEDDYRCLVLYYGREKFFNCMQTVALEGKRSLPHNENLLILSFSRRRKIYK